MFQQERVIFENPSSWRTGKLTSLLTLLTLLLFLAGVSPRLAAQGNEWTWMSGSDLAHQPGVYGTLGVPAAGNVPGTRTSPVTWTDSTGNLWLFGGDGVNGTGNEGYLNDLWKFTPSTGEWTWVSGTNLVNQFGSYGKKGVPAASNVPAARQSAVAWTDSSGNFWLFGGFNTQGPFNDLWRYTPSTGLWTWMSGSAYLVGQPGVYGMKGVSAAGNVPGSHYDAVSWTDASGNLWLFGGEGNDGAGGGGELNDLWKYTSSTGEWTWMSGSNSANQPGVYGTLGVPAPGNVSGARYGAVSWMDASGNLLLFGGRGHDAGGNFGFLNDLWRYSLSTGEWVWMGGSNTVDQLGVYGTLGVPAAGNVPGGRWLGISWTDTNGNLWLFGGFGYGANAAGNLNDLWRYSSATGDWIWMSGSNSGEQPGVYGTKGMPAAGNVPGGRQGAVGWIDVSSNLWLFGGFGKDGVGTSFDLNDLWRYTPAPALLTPSVTAPAPGSTLPGSAATFTWSNPGNLTPRFVLRLGTTGFGTIDVLNGAVNTGTSEQVSSIPANGAYLYATLWYFLDGKWQYANSRYTEAGTPTPPALTMPGPGSTLPGSTVTFGWDPGAGPTRYALRLGTTGPFSSDVYSGPATTGTSVQVTTVPTSGATLYATLWYYLNGTWQCVNATFTEASH
jgi:N-acetylneuraminic acid mutarotase